MGIFRGGGDFPRTFRNIRIHAFEIKAMLQNAEFSPATKQSDGHPIFSKVLVWF